MNFWQTIVETNTFNFAILFLIIVVVFKKMNISQTIENIRLEIINKIKSAEAEKQIADEKLKNAQNSVNNLDSFIKEISLNAEKQADGLSKNIIFNAEKQINSIEKNVKGIISSEEKIIQQNATINTLKASTELAKEHIKEILKSNPALHDKFIDESLEEI